ncbi:YigZ family protein [Lagierella sp.]|uniref:YigZ family protein n=1 Tax=Lagierella sp. TaxID=2849657 RepID=UPI0026099159|nr:YigZ family protein [Lagierella sp.]
MYKTILKEEEISNEIKKSIFKANISPVGSEVEAEDFIARIKDSNKEARHHCFAYIIGEDRLIQKYSDNGEPQGTAGLPILDILKKKELTDICVVVTRYFGGILLGASGLVRAYSQACNDVTSKAKMVFKKEFLDISLRIDYNSLGKFLNYCEDEKLYIHKKDFLDLVYIGIYVPKSHYKSFSDVLMNLTSGKAVMEVKDELLINTLGDELFI